MKTCCRNKDLVRWSKAWEEGGRKFKLEHRLNGVGRFLFWSVVTEKVKRFSLIILEGRGFHGGWLVLVEKLRSLALGVIPLAEIRGLVSPLKLRNIQKEGPLSGSFAEVVRKDLGVGGDAVDVLQPCDRTTLVRETITFCFAVAAGGGTS